MKYATSEFMELLFDVNIDVEDACNSDQVSTKLSDRILGLIREADVSPGDPDFNLHQEVKDLEEKCERYRAALEALTKRYLIRARFGSSHDRT